jgi:potassium-transporting ATPase KdpC subunit
MLQHLRAAVVSLLLLTALTGVAYPLVVTGVAAVAFPDQARGSLIVQGGQVVGSRLIGQPFDDPKYFWGRLSGTSPIPYTAFNADKSTGSSGTNLGPLNPALFDAVKARVQALRDAETAVGLPPAADYPVDLVTASGSGLDPHLSPAAADAQVARVARVRGLPAARVAALVVSHTEGRQLGVLGEPRVNVLELNLDLDQLAAPGAPGKGASTEPASTTTAR